MDPIKRLQIELPGIKEVLFEYASNNAATNAAKQLNTVLDAMDIESILYCCNTIVDWYDDNLYEIKTNSYVHNYADHERNRDVLEEIIIDLQNLEIPMLELPQPTQTDAKPPVIFISHRSSDHKYGQALVDFIKGLGVQRNQIIYSSSPQHKIPLDRNIYDYLRENIDRKVFMIILWSNEYLNSPACLNEMGAAWVVQCDYTNIYTPNFSFGNPKYHECAVDTRKMGAVLKNDGFCRTAMIELKNKIVKLFDLQDDEIQTSGLLDEFMNKIAEVSDNG